MVEFIFCWRMTTLCHLCERTIILRKLKPACYTLPYLVRVRVTANRRGLMGGVERLDGGDLGLAAVGGVPSWRLK